MGYAQPIQLLPSSGYAGSGIGLPVLVGRNSTLALTLSAPDAPVDAIMSVTLETSAFAVRDGRSCHSVTWRKLGSVVELVGPGSVAINASGADAFVRARYALTLPADTSAVALSLSGQGSCVLASPASRSGAGVGDAVDLAQYHGGRFAAVVSVAPAGQTLALTIERSGDGLTGWTTAATFPAIAAAGEYAVESADLDRFVRLRWTPSGAGAWTFGASGSTSLIFARARDRALIGIRNGAIPDTTAAQYLSAFETATATINGSLTAFVLPLCAWDADLRQAAIALADWQLLSSRSKDPARSAEGGNVYQIEADRWTQWLAQVGGYVPGAPGRRVRPANVIDSTPPEADGTRAAYKFVSDPPRDSRQRRRVVW